MQSFAQLLVFVAFIGLVVWTVFNQTQFKEKSREDWLLDSVGLLVQGILVPALQITLLYWLYQHLLPAQQQCLQISPIAIFLISFVVVDYLYYWNHRLLHCVPFWHVHQVHHTVTHFDVLGTSRNTLWASLLIIYLWVHALFLYLLTDSTGYILGVSLTSALDLWRHSRLTIPTGNWLYRYLSPWLVLPQDHAWHHSCRSPYCNYGANFKLWDRLHGTCYEGSHLPDKLGTTTSLTFIQKLLFPFV
ncbi:MAG: hypothetical protein NVS2B14_14330 [Chamaesiphon sp.]